NDARFTSFLAQLRLDPASSQRGEVILNDPRTDERLDMEVSATEVRDSRGAVIAIVSVMQDVGRLRELERRRLEQVLFDSEEAAGLVGKRLRERGVQVVRELDARLPRIRASADQLKQVVLNLLLNAADSMPKGGTITVLTTAGGASEAEVVGRAAVQIQVRD